MSAGSVNTNDRSVVFHPMLTLAALSSLLACVEVLATAEAQAKQQATERFARRIARAGIWDAIAGRGIARPEAWEQAATLQVHDTTWTADGHIIIIASCCAL